MMISKNKFHKEPGRLTAKASDVGIPYGQWPAFITLVEKDGITRSFNCIARGDAHAEYKSGGRDGARLVIFAD